MSNKFFKYFLWAVLFLCLGASMTSCQKEETISEEELFLECQRNHYSSEGLIGVYVCAYGPMESIVNNPNIPYSVRSYVEKHLDNLPPEGGQCINGPCEVNIIPDPVGQPDAFLDDNGYWHLKYNGAKYFQAKVKFSLSKLGNSARPDIYTQYTTDKWMLAKNGYSFWSSRYNPLGSDYTNNFRTAIADTMVVVSILPSEVKEMTNSSGQYYRDCYTDGCGVGPEPKSFSSVDHTTKAQFLYMPDMAVVHDTITAYFKTYFYNENFEEEVVETTFKAIL